MSPTPVSIAHVLNPVRVGPSSDLHVAQPVTFASIAAARAAAEGQVRVTLGTTGYAEDAEVSPPWAQRLPDLDRSVLDLASFEVPRKLPILADILARTAAFTPRPDLIVYSNVDIAVMPYFYLTIATMFREGHDGLVVNRRTITNRWTDPADLPRMYAEVGEPHPGRDCFVFTPYALDHYDLGNAIIGAGDIGRIFLWNIAAHANRFLWMRDHHLTFHLGDDRAWDRLDLSDYHDHNNDEARAIFARLETQHGPLHDREPYALLLPRPAGYWAERRYWVENPPSLSRRAWWRLRRIMGTAARALGLRRRSGIRSGGGA